MRPLAQLLDEAIGAFRAGALERSAMLADLVLRQQPRNLLALRLRADVALAGGDCATAAALLRKAVRQAPADGMLHATLAVALQQSGQRAEAGVHHRRAVALLPGVAQVIANKGLYELESGATSAAIADLRRAAALAPENPQVAMMYADALAQAKRWYEAERVLAAAARLHPALLELEVNRADVLTKAKRRDEAERLLRRVLAARPDWHMVRLNLGLVLDQDGRHDEAIDEYRRLIEALPQMAEAHGGLAGALDNAGRLDEAIAAYQRALELAPRMVEMHCNLGKLLMRAKRFDEAARRFEAAIAANARFAHAWADRGDALARLCRIDEALEAYRRAEELSDDGPGFRDRWLLAMHYSPLMTATDLRAEHERWAQRVAAHAPLCPLPRPPARRRPGRLRIGYVSPDLRRHSVAYFAEPVLLAHDRARFEVYCYMTGPHADEVTARIRAGVEHWRDAHELDDAELYAAITADDIDILVDLAGHTAHGRLRVFALKPAPVQASWIGYPDTTGLAEVDYRLTDSSADPPGVADAHCVEQLWRLDPVFCCYQPPPAPEVGAPPSLRAASIVYGCFNNPMKLSERTMRCWARLLERTPGATLYVKGLGLEEPGPQRALRERFAGCGVPPERLRIEGSRESRDEHLALYGEVDIALDPFPYHGTTTTMEALWMGVPVVTLAGDRHVSRVGVTLLGAAGHPEWIAHSEDEYIDIAVRLAGAPQRLAELRAGLRAQLAASPLLDHAGFTRRLEDAYREMWECHLAGAASGAPAAGT
jgi:predicted O-linked N-acetylglucosamine transferase (SPINDLY family)